MLTCGVHERSESIPFHKMLSTPIKINSPKSEYSLTQNFFDPTKSSPPNDFINKLRKRIQAYNELYHVDKMVHSLDKE
jgi:hypothetical protein